MLTVKPTKSSVDPTVFVNTADGSSIVKDQHCKYGSILGTLMYLATQTRPHLAVVTCMLASHVHAPTKAHGMNMKRTLRYISGTAEKEMQMNWRRKAQISAYVDANLASEAERRRKCRKGLMVLHKDKVKLTLSTIQKSVSYKSTESKYVTLSDAAKIVK